METLNLKDCIESHFTEYIKDNWGYVGPDFANGGYKIESAAGPLGIESTSGDITINPRTTYALNIATEDHDGAVNIGTGGTRDITIGSTSATEMVLHDSSLKFNAKRVDAWTIVSQPANATIDAANLALPNPVLVVSTTGGNVLFPTAANVVANNTEATVGTLIKFNMINSNGNALTVTAANAANQNGFAGRTLVASGGAAEFRIVVTSITANAETYDAYWC